MQPDITCKAQLPANAHGSIEKAILVEIERNVGGRNYDHWFHGSTSLRVNGEELIVRVGSPFLLNWMQKQFRAQVSSAAQSVLGPSARASFHVDASVLVKPAETIAPATVAVQKEKQASSQTPADSVRKPRRYGALSEFVKGKCNELPLTAARSVCDSPGVKFNPLYLHGSVGTGKTHLLEGIYTRLRKQYPALNVMLLSAEAFANFFTEALREHKLPGFRRRFRNVDVLLVDDVDFLSSKRVIQEEFLHTIRQLESHERQIVLTADSHPRLLSKTSDELTTRFLSGLVCRLESPDRDTRQQIVERKAERLDAEFSPEALAFVAQRFTNNVRELTGALNCLETYYHMARKRVGITAARQVLSDLERDCIRIVRMSDIEQAVCSFFGVEPDDLRSSRRHRSISQPRMLAMYLARKHTQAAYREIGQYFGGRNHSTVMSAEEKVQHWLDQRATMNISTQSWPMEELLEALEQQLQAC